jgi:hypothetical protein
LKNAVSAKNLQLLKRHELIVSDISKCITQQQFLSWQQMAKRVRTRNRDDYCEDCLPEYQREMIKKNKCRHPEVIFRADEDGFMAGFHSEILEAA